MQTRIEVSNPVWVRVKKNPADKARLGENVDEEVIWGKYKIGSGLRGKSALKGVTVEEEQKYLPSILGLTPKSENWNKASNNYWANFGMDVPADDEGYKMEAGLWYESEEDAKLGEAEARAEAKKVIDARARGVNYVEKFTVRSQLGTPIDLDDYLMWRYCLVYSGVANVPEDADKSPRIKFYLYSKTRDIAVKTVALESRKKAFSKYLEVINNPSTKNALLYLFKKDIEAHNKNNPTDQISVSTPVEKDLALETLAINSPDRFLAVTTDPMMLKRAFIERAIDAGELRRLNNTDIIYYGDNTKIGNNTLEAINFLSEAANSEIMNTIKARIQIREDEAGHVTPALQEVIDVTNDPTDVNSKFQQPIPDGSGVDDLDDPTEDIKPPTETGGIAEVD